MTRRIDLNGLGFRWALTALLAIAICAGSRWLWDLPLRSYYLKLDDFVYLARSRTAWSLWAHLRAPHNGHVVPLFLVETHLLARLAGSLEALPAVLSWASYVMLVLTVAATGHLVARETGRAALGLAAMAAVGFSSVLGPALLWYSAGQALAAGTMILAMLAALQAWRVRGWWWLLAVALLAATAAPLLWTAGYTAGLVGMAYLWADGRRACRRAAALPLVVSVATGLLVYRVAGPGIATASQLAARPLRQAVQVGPAVAHTAQAVCEALIINNLGLDAATTAPQALVLCALLVVLWTWSRRRFESGGSIRFRHINCLEAAGAVLVAASLGMVFAVRGTETTFDNLRALGWYDAMPELGLVLFVSGWWSGRLDSPPPWSIEAPPRRELLAVVLLAAFMLVLQAPRVGRVIFQYNGLAAPIAAEGPIPVQLDTPAELFERARAQRQALAALDRLEQAARRSGAAIRQDVSRVPVPGMPANKGELSTIDLLDLSDTTGTRLRSSGNAPES